MDVWINDQNQQRGRCVLLQLRYPQSLPVHTGNVHYKSICFLGKIPSNLSFDCFPDCSFPIEYCSFNPKNTYKQCLIALARTHPSKADELASSMTAPAIKITKCGISRFNGVYRRCPSSPFKYIHSKSSDRLIVRINIKELDLDRVWIIAERSRTTSGFLIHHYSNPSRTLFPPLKSWRCIAGIRPLPKIKHIEDHKAKPAVSRNFEMELKLESLWTPYPKIRDISDTEWMAEIKDNGLMKGDVEWVATEKVHGANMSLITDGKYIVPAKRTAVLQENSGFYKGWNDVVQRQRECVIKCFEQIQNAQKAMDQELAAIIVYGELFGGNRSGFAAEITDKKKWCTIQRGIAYSPFHHFYPFDILILFSNGNTEWVQWDRASELFKICGFEIYATSIMEGDLQSILKRFDPDQFETTIPNKLKLPKPTTDNLAEGIVLRTKGVDRVCIKYKAGRFGEISPMKRNGSIHRSVSISTSLDELEGELKERLKEQQDIIIAVHQCINRNRMDCVLSKMGSTEYVNRNKMIGLFTADVWTELYRIKRKEMNLIDASERTLLRQFVSQCIRQFVKEQNHGNTRE